jgi:hypothetical protein
MAEEFDGFAEFVRRTVKAVGGCCLFKGIYVSLFLLMRVWGLSNVLEASLNDFLIWYSL